MNITVIIKKSFFLAFLLFSSYSFSQNIPFISPKKQLIVDGKPFIVLGGELHNSSGSSMDYMESRWEQLSYMKLNTILAPVSWELIEPQEGVFDFSTLDELIAKSREHNLKLVILWFGTWKNACSSYAPEWVRKDTKRFFRSEVNGEKVNHISALCTEASTADANAFARMMKHIRETDSKQRTVIAIQVENETGLRWGPFGPDVNWAFRDMCARANSAFNEQVPSSLMDYLVKNKSRLTPQFIKLWEHSGFKTNGTWTEVFLADAAEAFMAWHTASYVNKVAAAGKAEYPLPFFANVWMSFEAEFEKEVTNTYPSGSPVIKMLPIWKAAASKLDFIAPDIYRKAGDAAMIMELYKQMDNPLFMPETGVERLTANTLHAYGMGAICFSPFAIDNPERFYPEKAKEIRECYKFIENFTPYLNEYQETGKMTGFFGTKGKKDIELGKYIVRITFEEKAASDPDFKINNGGIIIATSDDEFIVAGYGSGFTVKFISKPGTPKITEILSAYELVYKNGSWVKDRRLNGDETGMGSAHNTELRFSPGDISVIAAKVFSYE
jgi:beta-galactosidase GanA